METKDNQEVIREILRNGWPRFFKEGTINLEKMQTGVTQDVWRVNGTYILKRYTVSFDDKGSGGTRWERSLMAHVLLRGTGILSKSFGTRVRKIREIYEVNHLREYVVGTALTAKTMNEYVTDVVSTLIKVHSVELSYSRYYSLMGLETPYQVIKYSQNVLSSGIRAWETIIDHHGIFGELMKLGKELTSWAKTTQIHNRERFVLRHGDPNPENYIYVRGENEEARLQIVDWDYASIGLREYDLALFMLYPSFNHNVKERIISQYKDVFPIQERMLHQFLVACSYMLSVWGFLQFQGMMHKHEKTHDYPYRSVHYLEEFIQKNLKQTIHYLQGT